jgi:tetratricopeptide (TPR) repeat protein
MTAPLLSAVMIVRDEEPMLADCLASVHGLADEVVIVDTGSTDRTVEIAHSHGARVLEQPWTGDFSAPRNIGLDHARGSWILYLDADERLRPIARDRLVARLSDAPELGLRVLLRPFVRATPYLEYRLWRSDPRIRFHGLIHERVVDALHQAARSDGRSIGGWTELALDHIGYEGDQSAKHRRNLPLLRRQLEREPDNIFNWRHLARVLAALGDRDEADQALERAAALARAEQTPSRDGSLAWADLVQRRHEQRADVRPLLELGRARWPQQWLLTWIEAQVELDAGRPEVAADQLRALLAIDAARLPYDGIAYDERIFGEYAQASLALALFRLERYADAAAAYREAERLNPHAREYAVKRLLAEARSRPAVRLTSQRMASERADRQPLSSTHKPPISSRSRER